MRIAISLGCYVSNAIIHQFSKKGKREVFWFPADAVRLCESYFFTDLSDASGGYLSCPGKKDTKEPA
jgi:hypothetical protein